MPDNNSFSEEDFGKNYISKPKTAEEHLSNCQFQLSSVKGWLSVDKKEAAAIKAGCLDESVEALINFFRTGK